MIETPTVFVLGAGASMPYGYPSGKTLRNNICNNLLNPNIHGKELLDLDFSEKEIKEFRNSFFYSGKSSIDAFLEYRPEFIDIGKLVIAKFLIPYETVNSLFQEGDGKWYDYFYNRLTTSFDNFDKNKFSVITFNYDRSFEQFLFTALKYSYNKSDKICESKLKKIPVVHVHGQLGDLEWQNPEGRPYDRSLIYGDHLKNSAKGIKIIHEDIDDSESFKAAHKLLDSSEKIYFFGFGYNKQNLERLKISDYLDKEIKGIGYGLKRAEQEYARKLFNDKLLLEWDSNYDTLKYIRTYFQFE